jgi:hypothetical protein
MEVSLGGALIIGWVIDRQMTGPIPEALARVQLEAARQEAHEHQRRLMQGLGKPIISFENHGYRVVCVSPPTRACFANGVSSTTGAPFRSPAISAPARRVQSWLLQRKAFEIEFADTNAPPTERQSYLANLAAIRGGALHGAADDYFTRSERVKCEQGNDMLAKKLEGQSQLLPKSAFT